MIYAKYLTFRNEKYQREFKIEESFAKHILIKAIELNHKNWDFVCLVDGTEGSGKTVMVQTCALFCDKEFGIERIVFTPEQFMEAVKKAENYQAIIYDEAYGGLSSSRSLSQVNFAIKKMLSEIRRKNLFIFIVMPSFFAIDKNIVLHRARGLIHIYTNANWDRGFFSFYNKDTKNYIYINGKKDYNYMFNKYFPDIRGRFSNNWVVDEAEYNKKKESSTMGDAKDDLRVATMKIAKKIKRDIVLNIKQSAKLNLTNEEISEVLGITDRTIYNYTQPKPSEELNNAFEEVISDD